MNDQNKAGQSGDAERHEILNGLVDAVVNDDPNYINDVVAEQQGIDPVFIAEFIGVKGKRSETLDEKAKWAGALITYLDILPEAELTAEQQEVIDVVKRDMEFDRIVSNPEVGEEPEIDEPNEDWRTVEFAVRLSQEEVDNIRSIPTFRLAEDYAKGTRKSPYSNVTTMQMAIRTLEDHFDGELLEKTRKVLDWYVYKQAESYASGKVRSPYSNRTDLEVAMSVVDVCGSGEEAKVLMRQSLDKHFFARAESYASGKERSPYSNVTSLEMADRTVKQFGSSISVQKAMKIELDKHVFARAEAYATGKIRSLNRGVSSKEIAARITQHASSEEARKRMIDILGL